MKKRGEKMTTKRDYYEILGLSKSATADEIKTAYRKLAFQFHPDRNKDAGAEAKFKEISEAYAVLSDVNKRSQYDQYGHTGFDQMYSQEDIFKNADFSNFEEMFGGSNPFEDIFGSMFGFSGGARSSGTFRDIGSDLETAVEISLEEAASGVKKEIRYRRNRACAKCKGSGSKDGNKTKCTTCHGRGQVQQARRMGTMSFVTMAPCQKCHGKGAIIENPCHNCNGNGKVREEEDISIDVPGGIKSGMRIRLSDMGDYGKSGSGDLYVLVRVKEHSKFTRENDDLFIEVPIGFAQATLGAEIEIPTLSGKAKLNVPSGTPSHTIFRLRGEGMPHLNAHGKGDQLVRIIVEIPKKLTKKQRELLIEFEKEGNNKSLFGLF